MDKTLDEKVSVLKSEIIKKAKQQGRPFEPNTIENIETDKFLEMVRKVDISNEQLHLLCAIYGIDGGKTMTPEEYSLANHIKRSTVDQCWRDTLRALTFGIRAQVTSERRVSLYGDVINQIKELSPSELNQLKDCIVELSIICALSDLDHGKTMTVQDCVPISKTRDNLLEKFRRAFMRLLDYPEEIINKDQAVEKILRQLGPFDKNQLHDLSLQIAVTSESTNN